MMIRRARSSVSLSLALVLRGDITFNREHSLGRPVTAMGRPVVCTASALLLETIGNGGGI